MADAPSTKSTHAGVHNLRQQLASRKLNVASGTSVGFLWDTTLAGYLWGAGTAVPADADTGWAAGCTFIHTDAAGDDDSLYINLGDATSANFDSIGDTSLIADLASTANGLGASLIGIEDSGALITGTTVEAALAEIAAVRDTEALATDTAASVLIGLSTLNGTASCDVTLADGTHINQIKTFRCITSIANPPTVTVTTHIMGTSRAVYTLETIGDSFSLLWDGLQWNDAGGNVGPVETATGTFTASPYGTTDVDTSSAAVTVTLPSGTFPGQVKTFTSYVDGTSNASTIVITNHATADGEVMNINATDESIQFFWTGTEWENVGTFTTTV